MLPTPDTPRLPDSIYPPSEDSYLLLDTLSDQEETTFLTDRFKNSVCPLIADLGTGSGVLLAMVLAHARTILGRSDILGMGIDINQDACVYSKETVVENCRQRETSAGTYLTTINSSLFAGIKPGEIDLLIFNPPYVPTPDVPTVLALGNDSRDAAYQRDAHLLSLSYSGGKDGMEVTNKVLEALSNVLSARGVAYVLLCKANKAGDVIDRIRAWPHDQGHQWEARIVRSSGMQAGWERLIVLRIWRQRVEDRSTYPSSPTAR